MSATISALRLAMPALIASATLAAVGVVAAMWGFAHVLGGAPNGILFVLLGVALPLIASVGAVITFAVDGRRSAAVAVAVGYLTGSTFGAVAVCARAFGIMGTP